MSAALKLWYRQPADRWEESMPLGKGFLGAMIRGGTVQETIGLTKARCVGVRSGQEQSHALEALPVVRRLVFAGEYQKAQASLEKQLLGEYTESYLPLGSLRIDFLASAKRRIRTRVEPCRRPRARVYVQNGVRCDGMLVSNPQRSCLMRLTASEQLKGDPLSKRATMRREDRRPIHPHRGAMPGALDPDYTGSADLIDGGTGRRFSAALSLLDKGMEPATADA
jgi:alpha-L-fucosidase 2